MSSDGESPCDGELPPPVGVEGDPFVVEVERLFVRSSWTVENWRCWTKSASRAEELGGSALKANIMNCLVSPFA